MCICPVSCHQLILTMLWVMVPTTWPLGPGRGGLLSPTTALEVPAALFRVYLTPVKKMPCKFLQFVKVINLLTCISQLIHIEFGNYCCLQGQRGKRNPGLEAGNLDISINLPNPASPGVGNDQCQFFPRIKLCESPGILLSTYHCRMPLLASTSDGESVTF